MGTQVKPSRINKEGDRGIRIEREFDAPRDRVWRAFTDPGMLARWWARGNPMTVERFDFERGGHWRFVEHADEQDHGFEGRFREIEEPERLEMTFEWDGMPGHVSVDKATFEDLGGGRTRVVSETLFLTREDRDGMMQSGMEQGLNESYAALDTLLARTG